VFTPEQNNVKVPAEAARHERKIVPKRRFQQGCIRVVGQQWVLYFWRDEYRDGVIKRVKCSRRLGATNKLSARGASAAAQPILDSVNHQTDIPVRDLAGSITLAEFIDQWRTVANTYKPSTRKGMESSIRRFLPVLGTLRLTRIGVREIQNLITAMGGRRKRTCQNVVLDLFSILNVARNWGNQVQIVTLRSLRFPVDEQDTEQSFFTPEQVAAILRYFEDRRPWKAFFVLLANTGLRASEILGLRVVDLDFTKRLIQVRQSCWHGKIQTLKTKSSKQPVPMSSNVEKVLREHLVGHTSELLFVNRRGRPYSRNKIVEQVLRPALDAVNIPRKGRRIGLHAFRHTISSILLDVAAPTVAQRQLRHSSASTTLGIYGHVIGDAHREAMERVQSVLSGTVPIP
jgi:integrase